MNATLSTGRIVMAENESLDLGSSHRWLRVSRAVRRGEPLDVVAQLVVQSLYRTLRKVQKQIPLENLITVTQAQAEALIHIINECEGHDYARLFAEVAEPNVSRQGLIENYLMALLEKFSDQIVQQAVPCERWPQMHEIMDFMHDVGSRVMPDVEYIAAKLAENPQWTPRMRPSAAAGNSADCTEAMLSESLLGLPKR
jgi:hypothetical protein